MVAELEAYAEERGVSDRVYDVGSVNEGVDDARDDNPAM